LTKYLEVKQETPTVELTFGGINAPWRAIINHEAEVETYLSANISQNGSTVKDVPLVVSFESGNGSVLFTSCYIGRNANSSSNISKKLDSFIVSTALALGEECTTKAKLKSEGYDEFQVFKGIAEKDDFQKGISVTTEVPNKKRLVVSVSQYPGQVGSSLISPDGATETPTAVDSNPSSLVYENKSPKNGKWSCTV
jgi:hypothetical protein